MASIVATVAVLATFVVVVLARRGERAASAVTGVDVVNAPTGTTFTITPVTGPAMTIPDITPLSGAYEIVPAGDIAGARVRVRLDRAKLPADTPSCVEPTTEVNLGIMVFNEHIQGWLPLETTCSGDELVASAPHFSRFLPVILRAGRHLLDTVVHGVTRTVEVVTTAVTSVVGYVAELLKGVVVTFLRNLTATFDESKYSCQPPGAAHTAQVISISSVTDDNRIAGCVVSANGEEFRLKNGNPVPLSFEMPADAHTYLTPVTSELNNIDVAGLLGSAIAAGRGRWLVPGLEAGALGIGAKAPNVVRLPGAADTPSLMLDLGLAALAVLAPRFKAADIEMQAILRVVNQRVVTLISQRGYTSISITTITEIIQSVTLEQKNWASYTENLLNMVDAVKCFSSRVDGVEQLVEATFSCLGTAFGGGGSELKNLLIGLASQAKVIPELIEANLASNFERLTGIDITQAIVLITASTIHLYELPSGATGVGPSGQHLDSVLAATRYPESTGVWVGCDGAPATVTYRLSGTYHRLIGTAGLGDFTPGDITARITLAGDGRSLATLDVSRDRTATLDLDLTGVDTLVISAARVAGVCGASSIPYGALGDARLVR